MRIIIVFALLTISLPAFSQKKDKVSTFDESRFCGIIWNNKDKMKAQHQRQFDFLKAEENDTIVDIGSSSGWYNGAFSVFSPLNKVHFLMVDIDTSCLNQRKVNNMIAHYSELKGNPITNTFELHNNTPDSLLLPLNTYKKAWLINVLHEIPDQTKMVKDIYSVLRPGGELVMLEFIPKKSGDLHGGCRKPLKTIEDWTEMMIAAGFQFVEQLEIVQGKRKKIGMIRFRKSLIAIPQQD